MIRNFVEKYFTPIMYSLVIFSFLNYYLVKDNFYNLCTTLLLFGLILGLSKIFFKKPREYWLIHFAYMFFTYNACLNKIL